MNSSHQQSEAERGLPDFSTPVVMGILNLTPDSFFDGGRYNSVDNAVAKAEEMLQHGAGIIDLGAMSTRPFSHEISLNDEWGRLQDVLPAVRKKFPGALLSIDTYRSEIAHRSVDCGADIINDISGGQFDDNMIAVIARLKVPYIIMHTPGKPREMQQNPYYDNVVRTVDSFFASQIKTLTSLWADAKIILDPGFGFGKTVDHNFILLRNLEKFKYHGFPVLAGLSRKSMINRVLGVQPDDALNGTTALNMLALMNGAAVLRVHDVKEAFETIQLFEAYMRAES